MPGIAGWIRHGRPPDREIFEQMLELMSWRAPHGWRRHHGEGFLLAESRYGERHEGPSHEPGPPHLHIVGDVRYAYDPQRGRRVPRIESQSLRARWEKSGTDLFRDLRGEHALAIWDQRTRQLVLSRDTMGLRPLFYRVIEDGIAFASDIEPLRHLGPTSIDWSRVADFFVEPWGEHLNPEGTGTQEIDRLRPGYCLEWRAHRPTRRYATHTLATYQINRFTTEQDGLAELTRALKRSVRLRLDENADCGLLFSGGVDSAAIAALAARSYSAPRLRLLSVVRTSAPCVDSQAATEVAQHLSLDHETFPIEDPQEPRPSLGGMDDPFQCYLDHMFDPAASWASGSSVKRLWSGIDGDLVFSRGESGAFPLFRAGRWSDGLRAISEHASFWELSPARILRSELGTRLRHHGRLPLFSTRQARRKALDSGLHPAAIEQHQVADRLAEWGRGERWTDGGKSFRASRLASPFLSAAINRYDRYAASWRLDIEHPLLDVDLVLCSLRFDDCWLDRGAVTKRPLRLAMRESLPKNIVDRQTTSDIHDRLCLRRLLQMGDALLEHARQIEGTLGSTVDAGRFSAASRRWHVATTHQANPENMSDETYDLAFEFWQAARLVDWLSSRIM